MTATPMAVYATAESNEPLRCDRCGEPIDERAFTTRDDTARHVACLQWVDLLGIDPDYCDGKPVDEWLEEQRGEA